MCFPFSLFPFSFLRCCFLSSPFIISFPHHSFPFLFTRFISSAPMFPLLLFNSFQLFSLFPFLLFFMSPLSFPVLVPLLSSFSGFRSSPFSSRLCVVWFFCCCCFFFWSCLGSSSHLFLIISIPSLRSSFISSLLFTVFEITSGPYRDP